MNQKNERDPLTGAIIGAAIEVHRRLGPGLVERLYEEALCIELRLRGMRFERQKPLKVDYKGHRIGNYRVDLLVENRVIVELKAVKALLPVHRKQVLCYLRITGVRRGLLLNFNEELLTQGIGRVSL